jgi:hypothetical protein
MDIRTIISTRQGGIWPEERLEGRGQRAEEKKGKREEGKERGKRRNRLPAMFFEEPLGRA